MQDPLETRVATLRATNKSSGDIVISNTVDTVDHPAGALDIPGISNEGGGRVVITNKGDTANGQGITISGPISASGADVTINSGSPLTIDSDITAAGAIVLEAEGDDF